MFYNLSDIDRKTHLCLDLYLEVIARNNINQVVADKIEKQQQNYVLIHLKFH